MSTKKQKKEDKGEKGDRTETVSVVPSTTEKLDNPSLDESFSMMPSPVSILFGFEDHIEVSPIKGRLQSLFEPPARAVSPLPLTHDISQVSNNKETFIVIEDPALNDLPLLALTPEKSQVSNNKETFIVIEDPALNDLDLDIISSDVAISTKREIVVTLNSLLWQKKRALVVDFRHHQVHVFTLQEQILYERSEIGQWTATRTVAL